MHRTTIMIPTDLKSEALEYARKTGLSLGEMVRQALSQLIRRKTSKEKTDPFFADKKVFRGRVPKDFSKNHDDYLYGDL